jgi:hypothetical protein
VRIRDKEVDIFSELARLLIWNNERYSPAFRLHLGQGRLPKIDPHRLIRPLGNKKLLSINGHGFAQQTG